MKSSQRRRGERSRLVLKTMAVAVATAFVENAIAQALPTGGATVQGTAPISVSGADMTISQSSPRAVINWATFNIGDGASVRFIQPTATAIAVNRVSAAAGQSAIDGILKADGHVMILNPNGVMFGATARVNVGSLTASSGDIKDDSAHPNTFPEFMAGGGFAIVGAVMGSISNAAKPIAGHLDRGITAAEGGLVAFVAPSVSNSGLITASKGRIVLARAEETTVSLNGNLYEMVVAKGLPDSTLGSVSNSGTLTTGTTAGTIILSALDAANVVSGTINLEGIQQASRIEVHGGHVVLKSDLEAATVTGTSSSIEVHNGAHIQDAVDIAKTGAAIDVWGGTYTEGHANVDYFGAPGGQNFGLHVYKDNLLIRGLNASGGALDGLDDPAMPVVTAQYQTGFGAQHFISGSGVTIDGLKFKPVSGGTNKTLEVIGNDFTLKNSVIDNSGNGTAAAFYISDFSVPNDPFVLLGRPDVETFHIQNNRFIAGTSLGALVVVASGTGNSTASSNRVFSGNELIGTPGVTGARGFQIQGQEVGIPWQTLTAGAVTVQNNKFSNFDAPVRTVGIMTQELDWNSVFNNNTFVGGAALAFAGNTTTARAGTVAVAAQDNTGTTHDIIDTRITRSIQGSIDRAQAGDTVRALAGTYAEHVTLSKALTLRGAGAGNSTIAPASGNAIDVSGNIGATASVVIDGFTLTGATYGVQVAGSTVLGDLTVQNSDFLGSRQNGFFVNGNSHTGAPGLTRVSLLNDTFEHNGAVNPNSLGWGDILFNFYNGNATLSGLRIHGGGEYNGIQMRGASPTTNVPQDAGTVVFNDVTIDGTFLRPTGSIGTFNPDGPGAAIHLLEYASVANVSFNNVTLAPATGHGLFIEGLGSTLNIGNTNFGTPDPTPRGTAVAQHPQQVSRNILAGSNSNNLLTYADATAAKFDGVAVSGMTNAQLFGIEDRVTDALDLSGLGLVRFKTGNVYVTQNSETAVNGAIGRGVAAATAGDTVNIEAGAYTGNLTINKALTLDGAGIGQTTLRSAVLHGGDAVTITDASNVTLSDLSIADYQYGLRINGTSHNATVERVAFDNNTYGLRTSTTTKADNFRMLDSTITGGVIGVQTYNGHQLVGGVETPTASFANALFQNVTVDGPTYKGFYFETANNLTLKNVTVRNAGNVGDDSHQFGHAVDINLKYAAYDSITFDNLVVENSGHSSGDATRAAISIKTRGIPGDSASYTVAPASLQHVNIIGGSITGSDGVGLRVETLSNGAGGQPTVAISDGTKFKNNGQDIAVDNTRVDARGAVFAADSGGHEVTVVDGFAIEDRVTHALDASGRGLVTWQQGNVYVTQASGSVQRGVDAASVGETVHVASVTFTEDVLVSQQRNLLFNNSTLHKLTICDCAGGTGIGGTVTATGFSFSVPVVLLADLVLDTSAANGRVSLGAVDGSVVGAQMLTVRAGTGLVELGILGAGTRLGATDVAGGAIHFTGASYNASAFRFDAPAMTLSQATTTFTTNGGSIMLSGDIQNADASPHALSLAAGTGDVTLFSGGTAANPLGMLDVASNNFMLTGTLWVSGYEINALGLVTLSDHTLRQIGGGVSNTIEAGGGLTGSTIAQGSVQAHSDGDVVLNVAAQGDAVVGGHNVSGNVSGNNVDVSGANNVNVNVVATNTASVDAGNTLQAVLNAPVADVHSGGPANVSGSADRLVVDVPGGSTVAGAFTEVTNTGTGLVNVNGKPQGNGALTANADNSRVMPAEERVAGNSARSAAAPESGISPAGTLSLLPPDSAAEVLDQGWPVELDLTPGNERRRR